jgi:DNA-binding NarL/FixJ family response regulator
VLSTRELDRLPHVIDCLALGLSPVSASMLEVARHVPSMTHRQNAILRLLSETSHPKDFSLAKELHISVATLKRDIALLCGHLGAGGRRALGDRARDLGYSAALSDVELKYLVWP